ncbi:hypothetical protein UFOVP116_32 [uncultured Caudovirales phage]|uniref:Uncharacterized protein n=1 Tax=uncultured Caudovirales phage TaxID=2100421 RepID=A0A6J5L476_9CAUD|nr:hypothetical protein UFOVP116_32 [uncultured Caudovirales phage]
MSRTLEELFNLNPVPLGTATGAEDIVISTAQENHEQENMQYDLTQVDAAIDKIDAALPMVRDLKTSDTELDELADLATTNFKTLMDLGMAVDSRFSGTIFQTASTLLGHALTAKQTKLDKKLKMIDLQLKKAAHDFKLSQAEKKAEIETTDTVEGTGALLDRNAIIEAILKKKSAH